MPHSLQIQWLAACLLALVALSATALLYPRFRPGARPASRRPRVVFLFEDDRLRDATPAARSMLETLPEMTVTPPVLARLLGHRFPDLASALAETEAPSPRQEMTGTTGERLVLQRWDSFLRVELELSEGTEEETLALERLTRTSLEKELQTLRTLAAHAPILIWKHDAGGDCIWANQLYLDLADRLGGNADSWPPANLFSEASAPASDAGPMRQRLPVTLGDRQYWFDLTCLREGDETLHFAVDVTKHVEHELRQQSHLQTLSKTFALLSAGVAIFGEDRRLALFNPALPSLTGLKPQYLSSRPSIQSFLDKLREAQILPEPRNYRSWRDELTAVENETIAGTYSEIWTLPEGRTYRVSGKTYPEGAAALLFEDISDAITLTRRYRSEIGTTSAALDAVPEAIAIFSAAGFLLFANAAYRHLWHDEEDPPAVAADTAAPDTLSLSDRPLREEVSLWATRCAPDPLWARLGKAPAGSALREAFTESTRLLDGRELVCRAVPLNGGAVLFGFTPRSQGRPERLAPTAPQTRAAEA